MRDGNNGAPEHSCPRRSAAGGPQEAAERYGPVFEAFSAHVVHPGETGAGQTAKPFNTTRC